MARVYQSSTLPGIVVNRGDDLNAYLKLASDIG
jgi:hypothetical protein